jgi:hypothetical protein
LPTANRRLDSRSLHWWRAGNCRRLRLSDLRRKRPLWCTDQSPGVFNVSRRNGRLIAEAYAKGLVTRVVADAEAENEAYATAQRICAGAPLVAGWHKQWISRLLNGQPLSEAEKAESFAFLDTEDYKEGLAAFLEKRKPVFKAR